MKHRKGLSKIDTGLNDQRISRYIKDISRISLSYIANVDGSDGTDGTSSGCDGIQPSPGNDAGRYFERSNAAPGKGKAQLKQLKHSSSMSHQNKCWRKDLIALALKEAVNL